jgi:hypothetical protein
MSKNAITIKGGVLFLGSLFWEDERNAIQIRQSIDLGDDRRKWRKKFLVIDKKSVQQVPLPIGYGRKSGSRDNTFTMVLTRHYWNNQGTGLIAPYIDDINFSNLKSFEKQVKELALVEGIYTIKNTNFVDSWGAVAIYINPHSSDEKQNKIKNNWSRIVQDTSGNPVNGYNKNINDFTWLQNDSLLDTGYVLSPDLIIKTELDFLFCTYMKPNYKLANQRDYPAAQIIGEAMNTYSTYFFQNNISKIVTADDNEIFKHIPKTW